MEVHDYQKENSCNPRPTEPLSKENLSMISVRGIGQP